jgi:hypothetical protein
MTINRKCQNMRDEIKSVFDVFLPMQQMFPDRSDLTLSLTCPCCNTHYDAVQLLSLISPLLILAILLVKIPNTEVQSICVALLCSTYSKVTKPTFTVYCLYEQCVKAATVL